MKKLFHVVVNILTFGVPLFMSVLSRSRKFTKIMNDEIVVRLIESSYNKKIIITTNRNITLAELAVDVVTTQD